MPGVSAPLLCFWLLCCRLFKVLEKVRVRLNCVDCICSDYTAQTQSQSYFEKRKEKIPRGIGDEPRVILISALTLVYKYREIQSRRSGWHSLFHTVFHHLTNDEASLLTVHLSLKKMSQPNLLHMNGTEMDRWPGGNERETEWQRKTEVERISKKRGWMRAERKSKEWGKVMWWEDEERVLSETVPVGFKRNALGKLIAVWQEAHTLSLPLSLSAHTYTHLLLDRLTYILCDRNDNPETILSSHLG